MAKSSTAKTAKVSAAPVKETKTVEPVADVVEAAEDADEIESVFEAEPLLDEAVVTEEPIKEYKSDDSNTFYMTVLSHPRPWALDIGGEKIKGFRSPSGEKIMWRVPNRFVPQLERHHFFVQRIIVKI